MLAMNGPRWVSNGSRFAVGLWAAPARLACIASSLVLAIGAIGFYRGWDLITSLWAMPDQTMSLRFMSSYIAAFAASLLWVGITGELAALAAIAVTIVVGGSSLLAYAVMLSIDNRAASHLPVVLFFVVLIAAGVALFRATRSLPELASERQSRGVRLTFSLFIILLIIAATRCLVRDEAVFPWDVHPSWSTQIGLALFASAVYFGYGLFRGTWAFAGGQLAGFLAYDLVLALPYGRMVTDRTSEISGYSMYGAATTTVNTVNEQALATVIAVISSSAVIAIWYLVINRSTRITAAPFA